MKLSTFLLALSHLYYGQTMLYGKCELAKVLVHKFHFDRETIADWICLVRHESNFDTMYIYGPKKDGSKDYGLFQINDRLWCSRSRNFEISLCGVTCKELISNDISSSVKCAKKVFSVHRFENWIGWKNNCKDTDVSHYIRDCKY